MSSHSRTSRPRQSRPSVLALVILTASFLVCLQPGPTLVDAFNLSADSNLVNYWGQNSYGAAGGDARLWQKPLSEYCQNPDAEDVIVLAFLHVFNSASRQLPRMDLSNQCEPSSTFPGTGLLHCPETSAGVKLCQSKGKAIILSLGGAAGAYGFSDDAEAKDFAHMIWNLFLGGSSAVRPLDDATLDGIDLDIEGGSTIGYPVFIEELRSLFATDTSKRYYITAAPQCPFPDAYLGATLQSAWIDMVFVQYYNNYCGTQAYGSFNFNFEQWDQWAKTTSINKNVRVFLGVPASATAANAGYVSIDRLKEIMDAVRCKYSSFGGIMMWDISQAYGNMDSATGVIYSVAAAQHLKRPRHLVCGGEPELKPAPVPTPSAMPPHTLENKASVPTPSAMPPHTLEKAPPIAAPQAPMVAPEPPPPPPVPRPGFATAPSRSKSLDTPFSHCPVQGGQCETPSASHGLVCDGYQFAICDNNRWVMQWCAPGTSCTPSGCDFMDPSKKVKSCLELESESRTLGDADDELYLTREAFYRMWNWTGDFVDEAWGRYLGLEPNLDLEDQSSARNVADAELEEATDTIKEDTQMSFAAPVSTLDIKDTDSSILTRPLPQRQDSRPFLIDFVKLDASQEFISFSLDTEQQQPPIESEKKIGDDSNTLVSQLPRMTLFRTQVRIRTNDKAISPLWRVSFDVQPGQTVRTSSRGRFRQEGNKVFVTSLPGQEVESSMVVRFVIEGTAAGGYVVRPTASNPVTSNTTNAPATSPNGGITDNEGEERTGTGTGLPLDEDNDLGGESSGDTDSTGPGQIPGIPLNEEVEFEAWRLPNAELAKFDTIPLLKKGHR